MSASISPFELYSGTLGKTELMVVSLRGRETISKLYSFDIRFLLNTEIPDVESRLLGAPALLCMHTGEEALRSVHGIVAHLEATGTLIDGRRQMRLRLVPRLWLLKKRRNSRIFQDKTPTEVIDRVLDDHGIRRRWELSANYKKRSYCVQYQESDFAFVSRLLAEEGIWFCFEPAPRAELEHVLEAGGDVGKLSEQLLLCDSPERYPAIQDDSGALSVASPSTTRIAAPSLPFHALEPGSSGGEYVHAFGTHASVRTQRVHLRDYDFERPLLDLGSEVDTSEGMAQSAGERLEDYDHGGDHAEPDVSQNRAKIRLEQHRARAAMAEGKSNCRRLSAGHRFALEGVAELASSELTAVSVVHEGVNPAFARGAPVPQVYENHFECVPAAIPYRPRRPKRRFNQILESAVVVGPAGQEIFTDAYGRIKVQFHWDLEGTQNEHSSCWMRCMQPWAGASWGTQFIPRVGMEVLVSFLGGDCDKPVVLGSLYNATHPPPFGLPQSKTRSGIRTRSVGGHGANELSFEDAAGGELIFMKAERDMRHVVLRDHDVHVGGDQSTLVGGAQRNEVGGTHKMIVGGDESASIGGAALANIAGDERKMVGGQREERISGLAMTRVHGMQIHNSGHANTRVEGFSSLVVGTEEEPTGMSVMVTGHASQDSTGAMTLRSDTRLTLACGETTLSLTPDTVRIDAKTIVIKAKERLVLLGDGPGIELAKEAEVLADTVRIFSKGGSVELDKEAAHVDGPLVKLNCGAGEAPEIEDEEELPKTKTFRWKCLDASLKPYKNKTYQLMTQGFRCRGRTGGDGVIEQEIPDEAFSASVTLWIENFPQGERLHYQFQLGDLPPSSAMFGAQIRLRNLGYYYGEDTDVTSPEMVSALMEFQADHRLKVTGELDGETAAKLGEVHPGE